MTAFPPMMVKYIENNLDIVKPVDSERNLPVPCSIWEVLNSHCQSRTQTLSCIVLLICSLISTEFKWKLFRRQRNRKYYIQTVVMRAPLKATLASWAPSMNNIIIIINPVLPLSYPLAEGQQGGRRPPPHTNRPSPVIRGHHESYKCPS